MPAYDIGPRIGIEGEKQFKSALEMINSEIRALNSELKASTTAFDKNDKSVENLTKRNETLEKTVEAQRKKLTALSAEYDRQKSKLDELAVALETARKENDENSDAVASAEVAYAKQVKAVNRLETQINGAQSEINRMTREISENESTIASAQSKTKQYGGELQELGKKAEDAGDKMEKLGSAWSTAVSAPLAGGLTAAAMASENIDSAMSMFETRLGATEAETEQYREILSEVGSTGVGAFQDIAAATISVEQNMKGLSDDALANVTEEAMALSQVMGYDVSEVTRSAGTLMKQFGLDGEQSLDLIAKGYQRGLDFSGEFLDTLNEYSVHFNALGFSAEDMFNILIKGAEEGAWNLDKVGDAIKEGNIRLKDLSDTSRTAFEDLGLDADQLFSDFASGGDKANAAFMTVSAALASVEDETKRNQIGVALFGTQYEDLEKTVVASFGNITDELGAYQGTARDVADDNRTLSQEIKGLWNDMQDSIEPFGRTIVKAVRSAMPVIKDILGDIGDLAEAFSELDPEQQKTILNLGLIVTAGGPVVRTLGSITSGAGKLVGGIGKLTSSLGKKGAAKAMTDASTSGGLLTKALSAIKSPAGLATIAISGLATIIGVSLVNAYNKALEEDIADHFGDIALSAEEVEDIAKRLTENDWTMRLDAYVDAKSELEAFETDIEDAYKRMEKLDWKVSIGLQLTEDEEQEYLSSVTGFIESAQGYIEQQQYTVELALQATVADNENLYESLSSFSSNYYSSAYGELEALGKELAEVVNQSFEDGTFSENSPKIQEIKNNMNKVLQEIADDEYEATLEDLKFTLGQGMSLDKDSFMNLSNQISEEVQKYVDESEEARVQTRVIIDQQYEANLEAGVPEELAKKIQEDAVAQMEDSLSKEKVGIIQVGLDVSMDGVYTAYQDEINEVAPKMQVLTSHLIDEAFVGGFDAYDVNAAVGKIGGWASQNFNGPVREVTQEMLESLQPQKAQLESIAQSYIDAGRQVPEYITQGLSDIAQWEAMDNQISGIYNVVAKSIASNPEYFNALKQAQQNGEQIPQELIDAIALYSGEVYDASTGMWKKLEEGSSDTIGEVLDFLNQSGMTSADAVAAGMAAQYGLVYNHSKGLWMEAAESAAEMAPVIQELYGKYGNETAESLISALEGKGIAVSNAATELLKNLENGATLSQEDLQTLFSELGISASDSLIESLVGKEPELQMQAVSLISQITLGADLSEEELFERLTALGLNVSDSLIDSLLSKEPETRAQAISLLLQISQAEESERDGLINQMHQLGIDIDGGLVSGMKADEKRVVGQADSLGHASVDTINDVTGNAVYDGGTMGDIDGATDAAKRAGDEIQSFFNGHRYTVFLGASVAAVTSAASAALNAIGYNATGNIITKPTLTYVAEEYPEAIIPLDPNRRARAIDLWTETGNMLGISYAAEAGRAMGQGRAYTPGSNGGSNSNNNITYSIGGVTINTTTENPQELAEEMLEQIQVQIQRRAAMYGSV